MNRKISLGAALIFVSFAVLLTFMITFVNANNRYNKVLEDTALNDKIDYKLSELDKQVNANYIGTTDNQKIADSVADGYVRGLGDKYAQYMTPDEYAQYISSNQGKMVGIGVEVLYNDFDGGVIEVTSVTPGSPAEEGGMLVGDYIYKIEGDLVSSLGYTESVNRVKGETGTDVNLTVLRGDNHSQEVQLTFTRAEVKVETVKYRIINGSIGYVKIKEFNAETGNEFKAAMTDLANQGAVKYIFDVRDDPGGDLGGVTQTLDYLLPEGPIIRIDYKDGHEEVISSDANEVAAPMAVLVNGNTASAAELFCSALKDYKKATLVGVKTFGKGTMQSILQLSDNSALKISVAKYKPPFSDNYDGIGVTPNVEVQLPDDLKTVSLDKITDDQDTQLQAAISALG
ncbi:MAG: S41 family peptidase [Oscillospiraceae bacterium]|nr:S41 family peptidase [Oscillospiraceae bacterium]